MSDINKLTELLIEAQQLAGKLKMQKHVETIGKVISEIPIDIEGIQQDLFAVADDIMKNPEQEVFLKTSADLEKHKVHDLKTPVKEKKKVADVPVDKLEEPKKDGIFS